MNKSDPYHQLALKLIFKLPKTDLKAICAGDTKIISKMLQAEVRDLDWNGIIIDTLWADLSSIQDARWVKMQTEGLAKTLLTRFDFHRLVKHLTWLMHKI